MTSTTVPAPQFAKTKVAILDLIAHTGQPLPRKRVVKELRDAGHRRSISTVSKALAQMTAAGELVNDKSGDGYTLPAATAGDLRRIACLAKQLADATPLALWSLTCDDLHLADALEQLANTSDAVCHLIG